VKVAFQTTLATLLDRSAPNIDVLEAEQYTTFDSETRCPTLYKNYRKRGQRLAGLCLYEYSSQIFVQTFVGAAGRAIYFLFEDTYPQYTTYVQVLVSSRETLATPSLYGSFTRFRDTDNSVLSSTASS
jgi:hypothetical protein